MQAGTPAYQHWISTVQSTDSSIDSQTRVSTSSNTSPHAAASGPTPAQLPSATSADISTSPRRSWQNHPKPIPRATTLPLRVTAMPTTTTHPNQSTASPPSLAPPRSTPTSTPTAILAQQPTTSPTTTHNQATPTPQHTCQRQTALLPLKRPKTHSQPARILALRSQLLLLRNQIPGAIILTSLLRRSSVRARSRQLRGRRTVCLI